MHGLNFSMIVLGDHGMTEAGGHGGSSLSETHVPLVFIDSRRKFDDSALFRNDATISGECWSLFSS